MNTEDSAEGSPTLWVFSFSIVGTVILARFAGFSVCGPGRKRLLPVLVFFPPLLQSDHYNVGRCLSSVRRGSAVRSLGLKMFSCYQED